MGRALIAWGWAISHPGLALTMARRERNTRRAVAVDCDANPVLAVLERDGGTLMTLADLTATLPGWSPKRISTALDSLRVDGLVFFHHDRATQEFLWGATEMDEAERNRRDAAQRFRHEH